MTWRRCSLSPLAAVRLRNSCDSFLRTGFHMKRFGALSAARLAPVCHGRRAGTVGRMGMARRSGRTDYPAMITPVNHVQPVPRRVRAVLAGQTVLDTTRALYVWEWPH